MEYKEYKPHPLLRNFVECYWSALADQPPFREKESLIPDGTIELMFNFGDNYSQWIDDKRSIIKGSHIIGIRKQSLQISQTSNQNFFCVRFKLGGLYPFFRIPANLIANAFYSLEDIMGKEYRDLEERLWDTPENHKKVQILDAYLLGRLQEGLREYQLVYDGMARLFENPALHISNLAKEMRTNYKTLQRRFSQVIGLTPSELVKIIRFNKAVLSMYSCKHDSLTQIGLECGYYDQSHFIREFKALTLFSPREFLKEQFTIVQVIQPALADRMSKSYNF